ncbi:MAG: cytidylate kinase family protein [Thermoplasmatales archaeon]
MRITISGPPGSGKTTVAEILSNKLSMELVVGGKIFREWAEKMNISLSELGAIAEEQDKIDRSMDDYLLKLLKGKDNVIVESRLAGWLCHLNGIAAFKVFIDAKEEVRVSRIVSSLNERPGEGERDILKETREREKSEAERYLKYYGIDYSDRSIYDVVVDSSDRSAQEVSEVIISGLGLWQKSGRKEH